MLRYRNRKARRIFRERQSSVCTDPFVCVCGGVMAGRVGEWKGWRESVFEGFHVSGQGLLARPYRILFPTCVTKIIKIIATFSCATCCAEHLPFVNSFNSHNKSVAPLAIPILQTWDHSMGRPARFHWAGSNPGRLRPPL